MRNRYAEAFRRFEPYCQQEILGALVTHVGSSSYAEVNGALELLSELVTDDPVRVLPFYLMLKGVLDYVDNLSVNTVSHCVPICSRASSDTSDFTS